MAAETLLAIDMSIHAEVKNAMRHAALPPQEVISSVALPADASMQREDFIEPHVVLLDNPDQLREAMRSFLELSRAPGEVAHDAIEQYEHEKQHYDGALGVGAADVIQRLAVYDGGKGLFRRRYMYHLGTIPLDVVDPEARAVIIGHPEVLSDGDRRGLDEAGLSVDGVARIASRRGWPMPLSRQQNPHSQMPR